MATGGGDFMSELSETVLCCEICQEDFDTKTHVPRVLPCHHAFCGVCVDRLQRDGSLTCPNCRKKIPVEGAFPVEITRMTILDLKLAMQSKGGSRALASSQRKASKTPEMCDQHTDEKVKLFCKPCSKAVCAMCALTMHKKCEELVDLNCDLGDKKKEMLDLCGQLDKVQESFRKKAEESEASRRAVESNLQTAVHKVEGVFGEIISSATKRQAEVIEELRAKAESDGLLLDEQAATFRSLQAAAQAAAECGRECVALEVAAEICSHTSQLETTISDLHKKTQTPVKPAPEYRVATEKVTQLRALLKEIGGIVPAPPSAPVPAPLSAPGPDRYGYAFPYQYPMAYLPSTGVQASPMACHPSFGLPQGGQVSVLGSFGQVSTQAPGATSTGQSVKRVPAPPSAPVPAPLSAPGPDRYGYAFPYQYPMAHLPSTGVQASPMAFPAPPSAPVPAPPSAPGPDRYGYAFPYQYPMAHLPSTGVQASPMACHPSFGLPQGGQSSLSGTFGLAPAQALGSSSTGQSVMLDEF